MASPEPQPGSRSTALERGTVALVLGLLALCALWSAPGYLAGGPPVGDDASSHILASTTLAEHLAAGSSGWWMEDLNLGFPLAHFYQPLPHLATALVALGLGGPEQAALAYKLLAVVLMVLAPGAAYLGFRRLGLASLAALAAAVALTTLSAPKAYYGLTLRHFLVVGLNTLLWGSVFAPLALGEGVRYLTGRGRLSLAVISFTLLFLGHGLLAMGMVLVFVFVALFPGRPHVGPAQDSPAMALGARVKRLVLLGGLTGVAIAFWLLPQLMCSDYFSGWPTSPEQRADGFGLERVLREWSRGKLTDFHRAPVLAWLSILGMGVAALRARQTAPRVVLFGLCLFLVFTAGRVTFGSLVDWVFPPNKRLEGMMRWVAMLHLFFALGVGLGVGGLAAIVERWAPLAKRAWVVRGLLALALLGLTQAGYRSDLQQGLRSVEEFLEPNELRAWREACEVLRDRGRPGRVFTSERTGHGSHWDMSYSSLLSGHPMGLSLGVGVQDSLNYYYLYHFDPLDPASGRAMAQARLYNIRHLMLRPGVDVSALRGRRLERRGSYELFELEGEYGYFELIAAPRPVPDAGPTQVREPSLLWLAEELPRGAPMLRLADPIQISLPSLPSATVDFADDQRVGAASAPSSSATTVPRGKVQEEEVGLSRYSASVSVTEADTWLLLKVTPHPFWVVHVDGEEQPLHTLAPAFMGLALPAGEHRVEFRFETPGWQKVLAIVSPLLLAILLLLERRSALRSVLR